MASLGTSEHDGKFKPGLMIPIPVFPQYVSRIVEYNVHKVISVYVLIHQIKNLFTD